MQIFIKNIKEIVQTEKKFRDMVKGKDMSKIETLKDAWLLIDKGEIAAFGKMEDVLSINAIIKEDAKVIDATDRMVFPSFCDSHTHLVYAGSREIEYIDKIKGLSYEEIAKRGGGILNSAERLHNTSEEELVESAMIRLNEIISFGTGAVEIKSG